MGRPKAALPFGGATILDRLIAELAPAFTDLVAVVAPHGVEPLAVAEILARWTGRITVVHDQEAFAGPVPALIRGLRAARHECAFVCSCDLPLLRVEVARALAEKIGGFDAAIPESGGAPQPLCAAYRCNAVDRIEELAKSGESRLTVVTARLQVRWVAEAELRPLDADLRSFLNINTSEDYARALRLARF